MLEKGRMIGERYEILGILGSGGMADVYDARDNRLNRRVAIKILKEEYSQDKNFVTKFRGEAQSVAGFSHPNIVTVYDVGEDGNLHYIVMELVEGITLKKFIEKKGKLDLNEAVGIAIEIARGIEVAHNNNIIHRDIKPQNIIISKEGQVKVTDFGIAKVTTSNTIAVGQVVGSVHYISPEQARGGYLDEKSDIYSLGVTLYEMLSGRLPFVADNTVSVALLHMQEEATPLREIDQTIPPSIDKIVQKCMSKKPDRRYKTVSELIVDLKKAIANPSGSFVAMETGVPSDPTINISGEELRQIKSERHKLQTKEKENMRENRNRNKEQYDDDKIDPRLEKFIIIGGIIAIVVLAIVVIVLVVKGFNLIGSNRNEETKIDPVVSSSVSVVEKKEKSSVVEMKLVVPELKGHSLAEAIELLSNASITSYRFEYKNSDEYKKEEVIETTPKAGEEISKGEEIVITISNGPKSVTIPELKNLAKDSAISSLESLKLAYRTEERSSENIEEGKIIQTIPESGTDVKEGTTVLLVVSTGSENKPIPVPSVVGKTEEEAIKLLTDKGFKVAISYVESEDVEKGFVISQNIAAEESLESGEIVGITVSKGKKEITYTYSTSVVIDENPFAEMGESGDIEIKMDQDGKTVSLYSGNLSYEDFPLHIDNIISTKEDEAICYMYVNGELYKEKVWRITSWNKAEN